MVDQITPLPDPPSRGTGNNTQFRQDMDNWFVSQQVMVEEMNTSIGQINDIASDVFTGTSSTSNSIAGSGTKNFTTQPNLAFSAGQSIMVASISGPSNYMSGTVASYNEDTGALSMTVTGSGGTGTKTDWTIGLLPPGASLSGYALITDVPEYARDAVGAALVGGTGVSVTPNDGLDTITIALTGGVQHIPIPATSMTRRTTNGPSVGTSETTTNKIMVETLDFDQSTAEYVQIRFLMPKRWNESTVTAQFVWTATTTGNVVWGCQAVAISDDDPVDAAFGTAQTVTDSVTAANDLMITGQTSAITVGGSPVAGDLVVFQFYRDAANGSDTLSADAKLLAVRLYITTDAGDDS